MATKYLYYCTSDRLACDCVLPAQVILCIGSALVAPREATPNYSYSTIDASITAKTLINNLCGSPSIRYTIAYDDTQVVDAAQLDAADINGIVCRQCLVTYIEDEVGDEITVTVEDSDVIITSQHGNEYTVNLSASSGLPAIDCSQDLGSSAFRWADLYLCGEAILSDLTALIRSSSTDAGSISVCGGSDDDAANGSYLVVHGNTVGGKEGEWSLHLGDVADAVGHLYLTGAGSHIQFLDSGDAPIWQVNETGEIEQLVGGGALVFNSTTLGLIRHAHSNSSVTYAGGDGDTATDGAYLKAFGNTHASTPGDFNLVTGNHPGSVGHVYLKGTGSQFQILNASDQPMWSFAVDGTLNQGSVGGAEIIFNQTTGIIRQGTLDTSDTKALYLAGGGAVSETRGGYIKLSGNESGNPGGVYIASGGVAGSSIQLQLSDNSAVLNLLSSSGNIAWTFDAAAANFSQNATNGGDLVFNKTVGVIRQGTSDTADSKSLSLTGGGAVGVTRGAYMTLRGNEVGGGLGEWELHLGAIANSVGHIYLSGAGSVLQILNSSAAPIWAFNEVDGTLQNNSSAGGNLVFNKTLTGRADDTGTLAAAGSTITDAAQIVRTVTRVTGANATVGVKLPALSSVPVGFQCEVINSDQTNALKLYSNAAGELISGQAGNTAIVIAAKLTVWIRKFDATNWYLSKGVLPF